MKEKNIAGYGGGLILISLLIIILSPFFEEIKDKVFVEDGTPGFTQLQEIKDEVKGNLQNSTVIEGFQELVGNVTDEMREKMKSEYVECPVLKDDIHFVQCFVCPNFQSRVMGKVLCKGDPL